MLGAINKETNAYTHPSAANKKHAYICIECKNKVIPKQGKINKHHFAHHNTKTNCAFYGPKPTDSHTHKNAQLLLKHILESNIQLTVQTSCCRCNVSTDHQIPNIIQGVSSCQLEHRFDYNGIKVADIAILANDTTISYIFEIYNTHKTNELDRPEPWFEMNAKQLIEIYDNNINDPTCIMLPCARNILCNSCVAQDKGIIYFNQRGAGCGKTYESIQLIVNDDRFVEKEVFIYLTKMHSAKDVIYNELKEQGARGKLDALRVIENDDNIGKQYKINYLNLNTNKEVTIIIGTIDSFNYAVVNKDKIINDSDYFRGIVRTIKHGYIQTNNDTIRYANRQPVLSKKCLITIDEAQDLGEEYIEAFNTIVRSCNVDVYVIGDTLQSIWSEHNIHTHIDTCKFDASVVKSDSVNKVMRFHNVEFINFVNEIIPFNTYNLPPIKAICDLHTCRYIHEATRPYTIFEVPKIYVRDPDYRKIDTLIEKIVGFMDKEVDKYNYLPNNFMFIFPVLSRNAFAAQLETRIQQYWVDKFNTPSYQKILETIPYWKDKINDNGYHRYIHLHRSEDNKPINLNESENATRILSIHASKGNGCEVVFVLQCTESSLCLFSKQKNNLIYNSLLHVAITRQKKSLYFGIEKNGDDIHTRFSKFDILDDANLIPNLKCIRKHNKASKIHEYIFSHEDTFAEVYKSLIEPHGYNRDIPSNVADIPLIDWGNHLIRYSVLMYNFMSNIIMYELTEDQCVKDQYITILNKVAKCKIDICDWKEYIARLKNITRRINERQTITNIPIIIFDKNCSSKYYKYADILKNTIENVQVKIKKYVKNNKLPPLCPLESIVLLFAIKLIQKGSYADISITEVYYIMYCYDSCLVITDEHTTKNECLCHIHFKEPNISSIVNTDILNSNKNHYELIDNVNSMYRQCNTFMTNLGITNMKYNVYHDTWYGGGNRNFAIHDEFDIIGYNETHVVYFVIRPRFNKLTFNDTICSLLIDNFMLLNCSLDSENYLRYNGKEIYSCVLTLDSIEPIFYKLDIEKNNVVMIDTIKKYLTSTYSEHHELVWKYYRYCRDNKPHEKNSIDHTINMLEEQTIPGYIRDYFFYFSKELAACKKDRTKINRVLENVNNKEVFLRNMDEYLECTIDEYLGISNDELTDF
jgi:hypothetical protein